MKLGKLRDLPHRQPIRNWSQFHTLVRQAKQPLLARLDDYDDSILITGCQRSGTTALARLLRARRDVADTHGAVKDDELDGALVLAGRQEQCHSEGRHCFQTTYLNDRYEEYFQHDNFRLIWLLREPASVVHSMLYNWPRGALDRLFEACGHADFGTPGQSRSAVAEWLGGWPRIEKACASFTGKTEQVFTLHEMLGDRLLVVDYDDVVLHQSYMLERICQFVGLPFASNSVGHLHSRSVNKGHRLSEAELAYVHQTCLAVYHAARRLCQRPPVSSRAGPRTH